MIVTRARKRERQDRHIVNGFGFDLRLFLTRQHDDRKRPEQDGDDDNQRGELGIKGYSAVILFPV